VHSVGALAVALGVGFAVANSPAIALADETGTQNTDPPPGATTQNDPVDSPPTNTPPPNNPTDDTPPTSTQTTTTTTTSETATATASAPPDPEAQHTSVAPPPHSAAPTPGAASPPSNPTTQAPGGTASPQLMTARISSPANNELASAAGSFRAASLTTPRVTAPAAANPIGALVATRPAYYSHRQPHLRGGDTFAGSDPAINVEDGMVVSADGRRAFIVTDSFTGTSRLMVVDLENPGIVGTPVQLAGRPKSLDLNADHTIAVLHAADGASVAVMDINGHSFTVEDPEAAGYTATFSDDGQLVYLTALIQSDERISNYGSKTVVSVIATASDRLTEVGKFEFAGLPLQPVLLTPDGTRALWERSESALRDMSN
jgi:hypothetical protein